MISTILDSMNDVRAILEKMDWNTTDLSNATGFALRTCQDYVKNNNAPESAFTVIELAAAIAKEDFEAVKELLIKRQSYRRNIIKRNRQKTIKSV